MRFFNSSTMSWILSESHVTRQGTNRDRDNAAHERANNELAVEEGEDTWNQKETAKKLQFQACYAKSCCHKHDILIRRKQIWKKFILQQPEHFLCDVESAESKVSICLFSLSPSVCGTDSAHGPHPSKQYEGLFMLNANHGSDHHIRCKCIFAIAKHFLELTGTKILWMRVSFEF